MNIKAAWVAFAQELFLKIRAYKCGNIYTSQTHTPIGYIESANFVIHRPELEMGAAKPKIFHPSLWSRNY
jgi:hypothetical protein